MDNSSTENKRKPGRAPGCVKTGGRQAGTLNKKSYWLRDQLETIDFSWAQEFKNSMSLCDYDRAKILIDLLPYLNPKIEPRAIDPEDSQKDDLNVNISLNGLVLKNEQS